MGIRPDCSDVLFIFRPAHSSCTGASDILRHCSEKSRWLGRLWVKPGRSKRRPPPPDRPAQSVPWAPLPCRSQPLLPHTDGAFTTLMPRPYKRKHTADFRHAASSSVSQSILQPWRTATTGASAENTRRRKPSACLLEGEADRYSLEVLIGPWRFSSFLEPRPCSTSATRVMFHLLVRRSNISVPLPSCQGGGRNSHSRIVTLFVLTLNDDLSRRRQAPMARLWELALVELR